MRHDLQVALVRRVLEHLERKTTDSEEQPSFFDIGAYADGARIERENAQLFRQLPLVVAHQSELAETGDFITHDASGVPLLVVRRETGAIEAYLNVCRHRGTRVEAAPRGNRRAFTCPYHGWTYAASGRLMTLPHARGFACMDTASRGLVQVPASVRGGFVYVIPTPLDPATAPSIDEWLGPIPEEMRGFELDSAAVFDPRSYVRELSWKLAIDIFLETYHLRTTHKQTVYPLFFDNVGVVDKLGAHLRNLFPKRSIASLRESDEATWQLRLHSNILYHLFPNTLVLVQPDHTAVVQMWPVGATRTQITSYLLVPEPPTTEKAHRYWEANAGVLYGATDEDFAMGESIQRGVGSGANRDVVFGAFEHALAHFHRQIARYAPTR